MVLEEKGFEKEGGFYVYIELGRVFVGVEVEWELDVDRMRVEAEGGEVGF